MIILWLLVILISFILFGFWAPIKNETLIEGIFEEEKTDYDLFRAKPFRRFVFRDFCRSCMEEWHITGKRPYPLPLVGENCYAGVPMHSFNIGFFKPKAGEATKMVGAKTLFGQVRLFKFLPSDFVWVSPHEEEMRLEALAGGFTDVEEYKKVRDAEWREKFYQEAMRENGLTRGEAETLETLPSTFEIFDKEAKRRGLPFLEIKEKYNFKDARSLLCDVVDFDVADCLAEKFAVKKVLPDDIRDHLNKCEECNVTFMMAVWKEKRMPRLDNGKAEQADQEVRKIAGIRPAWEIRAERLGLTVEELEKRDRESSILRHGGKDCFTLKERIIYARTGQLPLERLVHSDECLGCHEMIAADREDFLQTGKIGGLARRAWDAEAMTKKQDA
ncbi:MAG TPA: hypothetical protein VI978_02690 [Candidatus Paceibacterota bacterium]